MVRRGEDLTVATLEDVIRLGITRGLDFVREDQDETRRFQGIIEASDPALNVEVNGVGAIDASPPSKEPHLEFNGPIFDTQYPTMPLKLTDMVEKVDHIQAELQDIKAGMLPVLKAWSIVGNRLLDVITRLEGATVSKYDDAKNHTNERHSPIRNTAKVGGF